MCRCYSDTKPSALRGVSIYGFGCGGTEVWETALFSILYLPWISALRRVTLQFLPLEVEYIFQLWQTLFSKTDLSKIASPHALTEPDTPNQGWGPAPPLRPAQALQRLGH